MLYVAVVTWATIRYSTINSTTRAAGGVVALWWPCCSCAFFHIGIFGVNALCLYRYVCARVLMANVSTAPAVSSTKRRNYFFCARSAYNKMLNFAG